MDTLGSEIEQGAAISVHLEQASAAAPVAPEAEATAEFEKARDEKNPLEIQRKKANVTLDELAEACGVKLAVLKYVLYTPQDEMLTKAAIAASIGRALDIKHQRSKEALEAALGGAN